MSDIILANSHTSLKVFFSDLQLVKSNIISANMNNNLTEFMFSISQYLKFANMSGTLAPGKHWTMVAGVSIFTFRTIELPVTRALSSGISVGMSLSGEKPV